MGKAMEGGGVVGYLEKTAPEYLAGHVRSLEPEGAVVCASVCVNVFCCSRT